MSWQHDGSVDSNYSSSYSAAARFRCHSTRPRHSFFPTQDPVQHPVTRRSYHPVVTMTLMPCTVQWLASCDLFKATAFLFTFPGLLQPISVYFAVSKLKFSTPFTVSPYYLNGKTQAPVMSPHSLISGGGAGYRDYLPMSDAHYGNHGASSQSALPLPSFISSYSSQHVAHSAPYSSPVFNGQTAPAHDWNPAMQSERSRLVENGHGQIPRSPVAHGLGSPHESARCSTVELADRTRHLMSPMANQTPTSGYSQAAQHHSVVPEVAGRRYCNPATAPDQCERQFADSDGFRRPASVSSVQHDRNGEERSCKYFVDEMALPAIYDPRQMSSGRSSVTFPLSTSDPTSPQFNTRFNARPASIPPVSPAPAMPSPVAAETTGRNIVFPTLAAHIDDGMPHRSGLEMLLDAAAYEQTRQQQPLHYASSVQDEAVHSASNQSFDNSYGRDSISFHSQDTQSSFCGGSDSRLSFECPTPNGLPQGGDCPAEDKTPIEFFTDNAECFRDSQVGGVAIAVTHGSILFEVAKRELHATTALKNPSRAEPTRISLVFYQHKNLHFTNHGRQEFERRCSVKRQSEEAAKMAKAEAAAAAEEEAQRAEAAAFEASLTAQQQQQQQHQQQHQQQQQQQLAGRDHSGSTASCCRALDSPACYGALDKLEPRIHRLPVSHSSSAADDRP